MCFEIGVGVERGEGTHLVGHCPRDRDSIAVFDTKEFGQIKVKIGSDQHSNLLNGDKAGGKVLLPPHCVVALTIVGVAAKTVWRGLILPGSRHSGLLRSPIPIVELISGILFHGNDVGKEDVLGLTHQTIQSNSKGREESPGKERVYLLWNL